MSARTITVEETTTNHVNTLRLVGFHPLTGSQELAARVHNQTTGVVDCRTMTRGFGLHMVSLDDWAVAVRDSVNEWSLKITQLEVVNSRLDQIGRDLFASYVQ